MSAEAEKRLRNHFSSGVPGALAVYLFGSEALGTAGPSSDVDVAVLYAEGAPATLDSPHLALEGDLERLFGRRVQVVVLNSAPPDLVHRVLCQGRIVFEADRSARIAFEVKARKRVLRSVADPAPLSEGRTRGLMTDPELMNVPPDRVNANYGKIISRQDPRLLRGAVKISF